MSVFLYRQWGGEWGGVMKRERAHAAGWRGCPPGNAAAAHWGALPTPSHAWLGVGPTPCWWGAAAVGQAARGGALLVGAATTTEATQACWRVSARLAVAFLARGYFCASRRGGRRPGMAARATTTRDGSAAAATGAGGRKRDGRRSVG